MKLAFAIGLQVLAFAVGIGEALIPSFGILTGLSLALLGFSWYLVFTQLPEFYIWVFLVADAILIPVGIRIAFKVLSASQISHGINLGHGGVSDELETGFKASVGQVGVAETPLRPTGRVNVGDDVYEAATIDGSFLETGAKIRVTGFRSMGLWVEPVTNDSDHSESVEGDNKV